MSEFDNRLIELVRANPSLYKSEVRRTPYDSSRKKRELWCSIATSLKTDGKFVCCVPFGITYVFVSFAYFNYNNNNNNNTHCKTHP